jgi:hypothetical protein
MRNLLFAAALVLAASGASAAPFTGTVSTFGDTTGTGPWNLTSEVTGTFSGVAITATSSTTFSELTDLNAVFQDIAGGAYGGSPRFSVGFVGSSNFLHIALGTSPNFNDSDPTLFTAAWSGTNVIGNNDAGRYDISQFGGSPFTDYAAALAALGGLSISEIDIVLDGGWGANGRQELLACNINVNGASFGSGCSQDVDDVPTLPVMAAGMGLGFLALRRKRKRTTA